MKRMLFNAAHAEELRVAIVDGQKLLDLDIETTGKEQRKSNIYKGVITRIEPSLEAAFVDYGADRHGFLPFKEVVRAYFSNPDADPARARIQDALKEGQELIVQIDKDERGNKGAALTTFISLAGRYLVLMPNNPRGGGVSRRIEGEDRNELREIIAQLEVPSGMSVIARTAGIGRSLEELRWDLNYLLQLWRAIETAASQQGGAYLIYQDASLVIRAIRDYFHQDIGEILIDTESIFEQARQFMSHVMPHNVSRVKLYKDDVPLFSRFQIEHQIETAYSRQVPLPSGGAVVIDHTEAMVAVDVNSARATKGSDIEETALRTNLEAADEIARQLRLRDLGGLVVIDFIDMESAKNQREVENRLRDALKYDRARVQVGKISRFGLLELSRQRLHTSLGETSHIACPRCSGTGHIRSIESTALHILRILQEEAMKENTGAVHTQVPVDVATYLLNEKRNEINLMEQRLKVNCLLIPNIHLETPNYTVTRLRHEELNISDVTQPSYTLVEVPPEDGIQLPSQKPEPIKPQAAVKGITPEQPAPAQPAPVEQRQPSILQKIFGWLTRSGEGSQEAPKTRTRAEPARRERREERRAGGQERRHDRDRRDARREERSARGGREEGLREPQGRGRATSAPEGGRRDAHRDRHRPRDQRQEAHGEPRPALAEAQAPAIEQRLPTDQRHEAQAEGRGRRRRRRGRGSERRGDSGAPAPAPTPGEDSQVTAARQDASQSQGMPQVIDFTEETVAAMPDLPREEHMRPRQHSEPEFDVQFEAPGSRRRLPEEARTGEAAQAAATPFEPAVMPALEIPAAPAATTLPSAIDVAEVPPRTMRPVEELPRSTAPTSQVELPPEMELVETRPELATQAVDDQPDEVRPGPRRQRPQAPDPLDDEPLVQVETDSQATPARSSETA